MDQETSRDDPWHWDVDRVVRELCTDQRSWPLKFSSQPIPDPATLEKCLREHEVDGSTLLTEVNESVIRDTFSVRKLSQIASLRHAVLVLRSMSPNYKAWQNAYGIYAENSSKRALSPPPFNGLHENSPSQSRTNKRRKVHMEDDEENITLPTDDDHAPQNHDERTEPPVGKFDAEHINASRNIDSPRDAINCNKKRKRIAPTLITLAIDPARNRDIPSQADVVIQNDPHNIEPGIVFRGVDGKKRLVPLSTSQFGQVELARRHQERLHLPSNSLEQGGEVGLKAAQELLRDLEQNNTHTESLSAGYLGRNKCSVDNIFYGSVAIGSELPSDDDQEFVNISDISNARRLYIYRRMKHYLKAQPRAVIRKQDTFLITQPYPTHLVPRFMTPSLTVFKLNQDGKTVATRGTLKNWPEIDSNAPKDKTSLRDDDNERRAEFFVANKDIPLAINSYDDWDPSFLEKYQYLDGGDKVLPLYGDSDEDGEYDIETWREIEDEHGTQTKPNKLLKGQNITQDEISQAIDEGMALMVIKWNEEMLPKRQIKAWKLWRKCRQDKAFKRQKIREAQKHIDRINNDRLVKMRAEILSEVWTSQKQVRKQTRIMEQSIFDREDLVYQISVLESKIEPSRPLLFKSTVRAKKPAHKHREGEEFLETESSEESSEDELDEFVVDDDVESINDLLLAAGEQVDIHSAAQAEDEDASPTLDSSDSEDALETPSRPPLTSLNRSPRKHDRVIENNTVSSSDNIEIELPSFRHSPEGQFSPEPKLPTSSFKVTTHPLQAEVIDLTILTSEASGVDQPSQSRKTVNLCMPEKPQRKPRLILKKGRSSYGAKKDGSQTRSAPTIINISDSEAQSLPDTWPALSDFAGIAKYSYRLWQQAGDKPRFLISFFQQMKSDRRDALRELFESVKVTDMWENAVHVMDSFPEPRRVRGMNGSTFTSYTGVCRLFEAFIQGQYRSNRREAMSVAVVMRLKEQADQFPRFYEFCDRFFQALNRKQAIQETNGSDDDDAVELQEDIIRSFRTEDDDEDAGPIPAGRRKPRIFDNSDMETDIPEHLTPHKTRKRKINENAQARELRVQDQQRLKEQDERRRILRSKLDKLGDTSNSKFIINDAKAENEGFVYVNENIAKRIKPHQVDGVRFLWNQIVQGKQGCLLAHTMGLGKTMQSITLLVAIADAARHHEASISSQIPKHLFQSRSLILCPPTLIDNWMDELLIWAPEGTLGNLRKVDSAVNISARFNIISSWYEDGGVLVIGYEMFRALIDNKKTKTRDHPLDLETHKDILKYLLDGPNIVIADEAHKLKNVNSAIYAAANKFTTRSRIALTGSPLANNIEEYHTMIEWVARNYLGPIQEFRSKYIEPIQQGLYLDSTQYERRKSLKMLGVLKADLTLKVHRADMSVLRSDLMPKTEFVITVPLTELQKKAYSLYVDSMMGKSAHELVNQEGKIRQTTLWHWLAILSLLCNHPASFQAKLLERNEDAKSTLKNNVSISDEDAIPGTAPVWKVGVSKELIEKEIELFKGADDEVTAFKHSNKVMILIHILDASRDLGDKVLIFSQSLDTLNFLENMCVRTNRKYARLDGSTPMSERQGLTKKFNSGNTEIYLISTTAGGLGLNLPGANRVVIFDFKFNPIHEEQAIGRVYRIGQKKPVFVYRFLAGGTFEGVIHNMTIFKKQLASRVVDKKDVIREAKKQAGDYLFTPTEVDQEDLSRFRDMDPVLTKILDNEDLLPIIRSIATTDIFERHDEDALTAEELREVEKLISDEKLKRTNPKEYHQKNQARMASSSTPGFGTQGGGMLSQESVSRRQAEKKAAMEFYAEQARLGKYEPAPDPLGLTSPSRSQTHLTPPAFSAPYFPSQPLPLLHHQHPSISPQGGLSGTDRSAARHAQPESSAQLETRRSSGDQADDDDVEGS